MSTTPGLDVPLLVGIAGGSGSGKSSLAGALETALGRDRTARICHDAYYRDRAAVPPHARHGLNYDVPDAFDQALFVEHLQALRAGRAVSPPAYSFTTHCRTGHLPLVAPRPIVLVEGILLLWDPGVRATLDLRIFLDAPERVRLERRLKRDVSERGRTTDGVLLQFAATVREAHRTYVEPTRAMADLVLGTSGRLEPMVEIAAAVILDHLARHRGERARMAS